MSSSSCRSASGSSPVASISGAIRPSSSTHHVGAGRHVSEDTEVGEIARTLAAYRIKRVPVVRDGRITGIVSRADLLRALATEQPRPGAPEASAPGAGPFAWVDQHYFHGRHRADELRPTEPPHSPEHAGLRVEDFRRLVADFQRGEARHREEARRDAAEYC